MAGWDIKNGEIKKYIASEDEIWALFNYFFSDSCKKRSTYKYGFIKAILDSLFSIKTVNRGMKLTYYQVYEKFAENYWNLIVKYNLRQMRSDSKSTYSKLETIFYQVVKDEKIISMLEFDSIKEDDKKKIVDEVIKECKKYVVGAIYDDFDGMLYAFDLKEEGILINPIAYEFMIKYKLELERLNYYSWARELEKYNSDEQLVRVLEKLELSTPHRDNLAIYREILRQEFEVNTCFYCGKKLNKTVHVDHFIPWQLVREDKMWNFVLACPECNLKKNNKIPNDKFLIKICSRNQIISTSKMDSIAVDFEEYSTDMMMRLWSYAKMGGYKEFII